MRHRILILSILLIGINFIHAEKKNITHPSHVIITAGQSNTDGRVKNNLLPDYIKKRSTDTLNFEKGNYPYCKISQNRQDGKFVPYWPTGRISEGYWTYDAVVYYKLGQFLKENFYVVKYAVGGTSIQYPNDTTKGRYWSANPEWLSHTASYERKGKSLLLSFTESIDAAIDNTLNKLPNGYQIDAFLWHQGESDDVYADLYYNNLKAVIQYVRDHVSQKTGKDYSQLPFIFGSIPTANRHFKTQIEEAMEKIDAEDPNAYLIDMSAGSLQNDKTHFDAKTAEDLGNKMYTCLSKILKTEVNRFYVAKYKGDKECAISYTFDDGLLEQATIAAPKLENVGFRGTFWVNGNTIESNDTVKPRVSWKQLKKMAKNGHEISNHGWSHKNLTRLNLASVKEEIQKNDSAILKNVGILPVTFCYPYNAKSDSVITIASQNRVDTRTKQFSVGGKSTVENLDKKVNDLIKNKEWGVTMTHGISYGYDHFSNPQILWDHLNKVKQLEDKIWIGTFREVAAYLKEEEALKYTITDTKNGMIITPQLDMDKKLFNIALTGVINHDNIKKIKVTQDRKKLQTVITNGKAIFDFNPNGGPINITITENI